MTAPRLDGKCMCGATTFTAVPAAQEAGICHCSMCRQWTGGMFISVACGDSVILAKDAPVTVFDSSDWGQRLSCAKCGSSLIWRTKDGSANQVSVQAFADPGQFPVRTEIFIDSKPDSYALAGETTKMTGAEVFAMFAPETEAK